MAKALCAVLVSLLASAAHAMAVAPSIAAVPRILPGTCENITTTRSIGLYIENDQPRAQAYILRCTTPSKAGLATWEAGFEEMPETSWVRLHDARVDLEPFAAAYVAIQIEIPDDAENYNRKWVAAVTVSEEKTGPVAVSLQVVSRLLIETVPSLDVEGMEYGDKLAVCPATVTIAGPPGATFSARALLRNNGGSVVTARRRRLDELYSDKLRRARFASSDYQMLDGITWIDNRGDILAEPGALRPVDIDGAIPADALPGETREELLYLDATPILKEGEAQVPRTMQMMTFVRVRYQIVAPSALSVAPRNVPGTAGH
jgi:hypothetical protein